MSLYAFALPRLHLPFSSSAPPLPPTENLCFPSCLLRAPAGPTHDNLYAEIFLMNRGLIHCTQEYFG